MLWKIFPQWLLVQVKFLDSLDLYKPLLDQSCLLVQEIYLVWRSGGGLNNVWCPVDRFFQKRFICCILHNFWTISVLFIFCTFCICIICICITFGALLIVCKGAPFVTRVFITSRLNTHFLSTPPHPGQRCLLLVVATCTIGYSTICSCFHFLLFMCYYLFLLFATISSMYT